MRGTKGIDFEEYTLSDGAKMLGEAYAFGSKAHEECPIAKFEMGELNKIIYATQCNPPVIAHRTLTPLPVHNCEHCKGKTESDYIFDPDNYIKV